MQESTVVADLAKELIANGKVTFSFFDATRVGQRLVVSVQACDEWDQLDARAEGNPEVVLGEDFMSGPPRKGDTPIHTSLRFQNTTEAAAAILIERLSIVRK